MDLASSIQKITEEIVIALAKSLKKESGSKNLCLSGGVALNCVANGKLISEKSLKIYGFNQHQEMRVVHLVHLYLVIMII